MSERKVYVSMPRHNGERYAKFMVEQFKQTNATLDKSRWHELFGTPERAARTLGGYCFNMVSCTECGIGCDGKRFEDYDATLEWLRGDSDGEQSREGRAGNTARA